MPRNTDRRPLPAVLRDPDSASRLATELEIAVAAVAGDDPLSADRRRFLARAAVQVGAFGTEAEREPEPERAGGGSFTPTLLGGQDGDELETRGA